MDALCHNSKPVNVFLTVEQTQMPDWPDNSPDLNQTGNVWRNLKNKVVKKQPSSAIEIFQAIKHVYFTKNFQAHCQSLKSFMPIRIAAITKDKVEASKY